MFPIDALDTFINPDGIVNNVYTDMLFVETLRKLILDGIVGAVNDNPPAINVLDIDTFVNDALDTFIIVPVGIYNDVYTDKLFVERFIAEKLVAPDPMPEPVIAVPFTVNTLMLTLLKDALYTDMFVPDGI